MRAISFGIFLAVCLAVVLALPKNPQRIIGGSATTIGAWPFAAALLFPISTTFVQYCGGTIITRTAILTTALCAIDPDPNFTRVRVGSTYASSGGVVHNLRLIIAHQGYDSSISSNDDDVAVLRTSTNIAYNANVQAAPIAGPNYNLPDNDEVWAVGWGTTWSSGQIGTEQLHQVQIWTINQDTCRSRYAGIYRIVTDNMLCADWLDIGDRAQCQGDEGSPLIHNNVVVGIYSWRYLCGWGRYPGVNVRVSRYIDWIQNAAA